MDADLSAEAPRRRMLDSGFSMLDTRCSMLAQTPPST